MYTHTFIGFSSFGTDSLTLSCQNTKQKRTVLKSTDTQSSRLNVSDVALLMTILCEYAFKWYDIGIALGFSIPELRTVSSKPSLFAIAPTGYLADVLNQWVNWPNVKHPMIPTMDALEMALKSKLVGLGSVSENIRAKLPTQQDQAQTAVCTTLQESDKKNVPDCVKEYAEFLKSKYRDAMPLMPMGEWPPNIGKRYCDLTIVERNRDSLPNCEVIEERNKAYFQGKVNKVSENERKIECLDDIFDPTSNSPLKVVIEGVPGAGKSTFVRKSSKDWAEGKSLQQFQLVVLVTLKEEEIRCAKSIEQLLISDDLDVEAEVIKHLKKTSGEKVLFILDGFDELNEEEQSFFLKLCQGKQLHKCSIILTSRSYAVEDFKYEEWIHRHVEILGFTQKQIESYIVQNISDSSKAQSLTSSLREETSFTSVSYTPLNCSILLYIFKQGNYQLPSTLTELFEAFVCSLLKRDSRKQSHNHLRNTSSNKPLKSLPEPLNSRFFALCKLAYDGLCKGKFSFSFQDIYEVCQTSDGGIEANLLSLLVSTTSFSSHGEESHYQFLHVTVQEFLAAQWIADQDEDVQLRFLSRNWVFPKMRHVLLFYTGITGFTGDLCKRFYRHVRFTGYLDDVLCRHAQRVSLHGQHPLSEQKSIATSHVSHVPSCGDLNVRKPTFFPKDKQIRKIPRTTIASVQDRVPLQDSQLLGEIPRKTIGCVGDQKNSSSRNPAYNPFSSQSKPTASRGSATQAFLNIATMLTETSDETFVHCFTSNKRKRVHAIRLGYCRLTAVECSAIAKFISKCSSKIKFLCFDFCNLSDQSLKIFDKVSNSVHCNLQCCPTIHLNYCASTFSAGLVHIPRIPWFNQTKVVHLHGLQYPNGLNSEAFNLYSILSLKELTHLIVTVTKIPKNHVRDYEAVFLKFVEALQSNNTLKSLTYDQTPSAATCDSFVQLLTAITHTNASLTLGQTKVVTSDKIIIAGKICFKLCSKGLVSAMKLADARNIKILHVYQNRDLFVPCKSYRRLQFDKLFTTYDQSDKVTLDPFYIINCPADALAHFANMFNEESTINPIQCTEVTLNRSIPSSPSTILPKIASFFRNTKILCLQGLDYPLGHCPEDFPLHSVCSMVNLTHLTVTIGNIPKKHLLEYETVFLRFIEALNTNNTLQSLTYDQYPPLETCQLFVQLISSLTHTKMSLTLRNIEVITMEFVLVPVGICFTMCLSGFASLLRLANTRHIKIMQIHHPQALLPCHNCKQLSMPESTTVNQPESESTCYLGTEKSPVEHGFEASGTFSQEQTLPENLLNHVSVLLANNTTLLSIDVSRCSTTDAIVQSFAEGFLHNRSVEVLRMKVTDKGAVNILQAVLQNPNSGIEIVHLSNVELHTSRNPYYITMAGNTSRDHSLMSFILSKVNDLKGLVIQNSCGYKQLALHVLSSFEEYQQLEERFKLNVLQVTEEKQSFFPLGILQLSDYAFYNEAIITHITAAIAGNVSFKMLILSQNNISLANAVEIFRALRDNTVLVEFDLSHNNWYLNMFEIQHPKLKVDQTEGESESLGCVIEEFLRVNQTVKILHLTHCGLNDVVASHIATGLARNHSVITLKLSNNSITCTEATNIFKSLQNNTTLEDIDLKFNPFQLQQNPLNSDEDDNSLGLVVENMLVENQTLRSLNLQRCGLDDTFAANVANGIASNHSVNVLDLSINSNVTPVGALSVLESLEINGTLEEVNLTLSESQLQQPLPETDDHESLGCVIERVLSVNQTLRSIRLGYHRLDDETAACIARGLAKNRSLKRLDLNHNNITGAGALCMLKGIENNVSLEELDLSNNGFQLQQPSDNGADETPEDIVKTLQAVNETRKKLDFATELDLIV